MKNILKKIILINYEETKMKKYRIVKILDLYYLQRRWFWNWEYFKMDYYHQPQWRSDYKDCKTFKTVDEIEIFVREKLQPKVIKVLD